MPLFTSTAVAASPSVTRTVTNKALSNNIATITVSSAHPFVADDRVSVTGVDSTFNGTHRIISVPNSTSFTYAKAASNVASTSATGTVTLQSLVWKNITDMFVNVGGLWKRVSGGFVKVGTQWKQFFTLAVTPSIASTVTVSSNSTSFPATLTGTNYNWTNATSLTYVFQKSSDNVSFTDIGTAQAISNPAVSNTVTLTLARADFPDYNSYFRFSVTATNSTYSTSATSNSSSVSVNKGAPFNTAQPSVTPSTGTAGTTEYSVTNGTWDPDDTDQVYGYQWQYNDQGSTYISISGATSSTYTPPSNFFDSYKSPIRCRVRATNSVGSTDAFSTTATVSSPAVVPSGGTVTLSGSGLATKDITATTSGWSGSPTSYTVRIFADTTSPPTTADILKATNSGGVDNVSYTVTVFDASPPAYYFKAFATATNSTGTSSEVGSDVILSFLGPTVPGTPTITYDSANSTPSNWAYDVVFTPSETGTGTIQYQLECQASNDQVNVLTTTTRPSSGLYAVNVVSSQQNIQDVLLSRTYTFWRVRARATRDGGTTWTDYSAYSNWA